MLSPVCQKEVAHAVENSKRLIPMLHRDVGGLPVPEAVAALNYLFARADDDLATVVTRLLETIDTDLDWVRAHSRVLRRAQTDREVLPIKNFKGGRAAAICISPCPRQFLYSSNSNLTEDPFLDGEIYKMQLDGTIVGRIGRAGKQMKESSMVNAIDCRDPNTLYVAELMNWRVQKITLKN